MVTPTPTALTRARQSLQQVVERHRSAGLQRLPTLTVLASAAGVGRVTMCRAVGEAVRSGALVSARSAGIRLREETSLALPATSANARAYARVRVEQSLRSDLGSGAHPFGGQLPTLKLCAARYGCSQATLRRALEGLAADGVVERQGRRFIVPGRSRVTRQGQVVLLARGSPTGSPEYILPRQQKYLFALEQECTALRLVLRFVPCYYPSGETMRMGEAFARGIEDDALSPVLGYVLWADGLTADFLREQAGSLSRRGIPTAVLQEGLRGEPDAAPPGRSVRLVRLDIGYAAGVQMGRYLGRLGHRRVAYLPAPGMEEWSTQRLEGMRRGLRMIGSGAEVVPLQPPAYDRSARTAVWGTAGGLIARHMQPAWARLKRVTGVDWWGSFRDHTHSEMAAEALREQALLAYRDQVLAAARDRTITAWVGANDVLAAGCLTLLRSAERPVPRALSVAGFDDSVLASERRLTSYNFGGEAALHQMLDFIVRPGSSPPRSGRTRPVFVEGFVRERATSGSAPARAG